MIKVVVDLIKVDDKHIPYKFQISGHALYDDYGKDIVCAGVSTLAITIANSLMANCPNEVNVKTIEKDNTILIEIPSVPKGESSKEAAVLARTLLMGLKSIEIEYGDKYISVKEEMTND